MVARLRHIAISVPDPEKAAQFFEQAFGMKRAGKAGLGLYMSDGTVNVALLKFPGDVPGMPPGKPYYGLIHFGMWVDDLDQAAKQVEKAGAPRARPASDLRSRHAVVPLSKDRFKTWAAMQTWAQNPGHESPTTTFGATAKSRRTTKAMCVPRTPSVLIT